MEYHSRPNHGRHIGISFGLLLSDSNRCQWLFQYSHCQRDGQPVAHRQHYSLHHGHLCRTECELDGYQRVEQLQVDPTRAHHRPHLGFCFGGLIRHSNGCEWLVQYSHGQRNSQPPACGEHYPVYYGYLCRAGGDALSYTRFEWL